MFETALTAEPQGAEAPLLRGGGDLSALSWVHGELRRSLEAAHKALRRHLKEQDAARGSDLGSVDPSVLRGAKAQFHQGAGALMLVEQHAAAEVLRTSEAVVVRMTAKPAMVDLKAIEAVERSSFALLDFLARQLAGKPVSPLQLFPQYQVLRALAGIDRIHPADLWPSEWQWQQLPAEDGVLPVAANDAARSQLESQVLGLMRPAAPDVLQRQLLAMSDLCAGLGAGAEAGPAGSLQTATFWRLAAAVFQAQGLGLLPADVYTKRIASGLLSQLRQQVKGAAGVPERNAQDLLFFCSHAGAPADPALAPRLMAVRSAWQLDEHPTGDYESTTLGRYDPAVLALARKRVAAAKDSWSAVAGGEMHRATGLSEQFTLVGESLQRLFPQGEGLAKALLVAVGQTVAAGAEPGPSLAMEVATAMLYVDASLEEAQFDHPELAARIQRLARRIDDVRIGADPQPLDPWMEELYRRVSDRQTMGSVVQELRASLSEIEKQIDQYFRDPARRELLIAVPGQLSAMRGVLSVLGMGQASQAALHMRDDVEALAQTEVDPQQAVRAGTFNRLADNLGALSFLIDMLSVQPQLAKSLFRFDPATGSLSAVMGQKERLSAFAAFDAAAPEVQPAAPAAQPPADALHAAAPQSPDPTLALAESAAVTPLTPLTPLTPATPAVPAAVATSPAATPPGSLAASPPAVADGDSGLEDDAEMREVFIEEAREVLTDAAAALERLADAPDNGGDLTAVRRAFHTLKGSARMVGLREYGEAGWACEQLYNDRLASAPRMDGPLRAFTGEALAYLAGWTEAIAAGQAVGHHAATVTAAADALRLHGLRLPLVEPERPLPAGAEVPAVLALEEFPDAVQTPAPDPAPDPAPEPTPEPVLEAAPDAEPEAEPDAPREPGSESEQRLEMGGDELDFELPDWAAGPTERVEAASSALLGIDLDFGDDLQTGAEPQAAQAAAPAASAPAIDGPAGPFERTLPLGNLQVRVPDLPSAADLDLDFGPDAVAPAADPVSASVPLSLDFDLDFDGLDEARPDPGPDPEIVDARPAANAPDTPDAIPEAEAVEIEVDDIDSVFGSLSEPAVPPSGAPLQAALDVPTEEEPVKIIGRLRISIPLFNIFLNEADELSRRLRMELAEWALECERHPVPESASALAHALAGNSATVGYTELSALARALEHALSRSHDQGVGDAEEAGLFSDAAEDISHLLHQFAAGFLRGVAPELMERLAAHERRPPRTQPELPTEALEAVESLEPLETLEPVEPEESALQLMPVLADPGLPPEPTGQQAARPPAETVDDLDADLFPIFEEETEELLPQLQSRLREWQERPDERDAMMACMRTLHTIKGGARLTGAMRLGEMAHRLESDIEALGDRGDATAAEVGRLMAQADAMSALFDAMRKPVPARPVAGPPLPLSPAPVDLSGVGLALPPRSEPVPAPVPEPVPEPTRDAVPEFAAEPAAPPTPEPAAAPWPEAADSANGAEAVEPASAEATPPVPVATDAPVLAVLPIVAEAMAEAMPEPMAEPMPEPMPEPAPAPAVGAAPIDWSRFASGDDSPAAPVERAATTGGAVVRVRAGLLDRLVNQAGEVSITRARIDSDVKLLQGSLGELTESLERMRRQLRDIEVQAETQITSRIEAAKAAAQDFDPLEMDRFTRFQELTRFMAESVNDVATLQRSLQRTLQSTEDELAAQARLTRELQDDLLRTRMIEFDSIAERLYRTVRQAAKDTGKDVKVDIVGGAIEVDRGVLERMVGPFEHLLRNSVAHGVEAPAARVQAGKSATGSITITIEQVGNEVGVEFSDDGAGLNLDRIRQRGLERGLLAADAQPTEAELAALIFAPGFSTAESVTELAGRGVGLDVVRAEAIAMGGRVETKSQPGKGTQFKLLLPLTTAVTQVVMLRSAELQVAVPSPLIELVRRVPVAEVERAYAVGHFEYAGEQLPFFWLAALLGGGQRSASEGRSRAVVIVRSAAQRVAVHVDEIVGNQEVVVKNIGPQLARMPGLAGVTLLPSGTVALIYNPVALASLYGVQARALQVLDSPGSPGLAPAAPAAALPSARSPMVMVVDDSLTVRRVTQRLLVREGYRVVLAKDGLDALERLAEERPTVLLSDIEMPRMDGFDLVRNVRATPDLAELPVIMITSRIAQKHRDYAEELGVQHYLGKPYSEEELLMLVARYTRQAARG